jgi:hypothetical protein
MNADNKNNTLLWFLGGLWLGGTPLFATLFGCFGFICIVIVFTFGMFLSAVTTAVVLHWKSLLLFLFFASIFIGLGYLYLLEEKKKRENKG